ARGIGPGSRGHAHSVPGGAAADLPAPRPARARSERAMFGYATARQLTDTESDTAEEPLGAPRPLRPRRVAAALCAPALLVWASCSVAATTGEVRPSAPGMRGDAVLDVVSKEGKQRMLQDDDVKAQQSFSKADTDDSRFIDNKMEFSRLIQRGMKNSTT
ncbi:unnamed protein product, partial [Prorocentrum cordatum]